MKRKGRALNRERNSGDVAAVLAGAVALLGFAATFVPFGPERIRFLAVAGGIFFAVGYALLRGAARDSKDDSALALAFPVSCAVCFLPLLAGELAGAGTKFFAWLVRPLLLAASVVLFARARRTAGRTPSALLLFALLIAAAALAKGGLVTLPSDALDHIAVLREIQETEECFPLTSYYAESTDERLDARKGFVLPAAAAAGSLAGAGARAVHDTLPGLTAFLFTISFFALARESLGGTRAAVLALAFAVLSWEGGVFGAWFGRSASPYLFAAPVLWCALQLVLRAAREGRAPAAGLLLAGFALMGIHVFSAVTALLLGGLYLSALAIAPAGRGARKPAFLSLVFLAAGALPIGIWRLATSYPPLDPIHTHLQGIVHVTDRFYTANPLLAFDRVGLFGLAGIPLALLLLRSAGKDRGVLFAVSTALLPFLLILNPLLVPFLVPFVGYLLGRIVWFGGQFLVLGFLAARWTETAARGKPAPTRIGALAGLVALCVLFAGSLRAADAADLRMRLVAKPHRLADAARPEAWSDLFAFMERELPPRAAVATDPITGYLIPACTPQKTIALLEQHSSTGDPLAPKRVRDMIRAMSPYVSGAETARILNHYHADYVLINFRLLDRYTSYLASLDPGLYEPTLEKFRREPERYREIYARDRCHLFAVRDEESGGEKTAVLSAQVEALPAAASRADRLFPNGVRLAGALASSDTIRAGGTLALACYWSKDRETDDPLPYKVYLRLAQPGGAAGGAWAKWERKVREIRTGRLARARTMRNLLRGAYPPEEWPAGALVADTIRWMIPADLEPGLYDLEVALRRSSFIRNYRLRDFVSERDSFSGVAVGRLVVRPAAGPPPRLSGERNGTDRRNVLERAVRRPFAPENRNRAESAPGLFANERGGGRPALRGAERCRYRSWT
jgi:hypothetical protein